MRNLQEQVKKAFCYHLKIFANSPPSASNFKSFSRSLEQFFLTVGQNNFGNKIPYLIIHFSWKNVRSPAKIYNASYTAKWKQGNKTSIQNVNF